MILNQIKLSKNIPQTATFSIATTNAKSIVDSSEFRKVAFAIKFSIKRGELGSDFKNWNDSVTIYLNDVSELIGADQAKVKERDAQLNSFRSSLKTATTPEDKKNGRIPYLPGMTTLMIIGKNSTGFN